MFLPVFWMMFYTCIEDHLFLTMPFPLMLNNINMNFFKQISLESLGWITLVVMYFSENFKIYSDFGSQLYFVPSSLSGFHTINIWLWWEVSGCAQGQLALPKAWLHADFLYTKSFPTRLNLILFFLTREYIPDRSYTTRETSAKFFLECAVRLASISILDTFIFLREFTDFWAQLNSLFSRRKFHSKDLT